MRTGMPHISFRIMPCALYIAPAREVHIIPTTQTSSIAKCFINSAARMGKHGRSGLPPVCHRKQRVAAKSAAMSRAVSATTKPANRTKASRRFNSPSVQNHVHKVHVARQMLTSASILCLLRTDFISGFIIEGMLDWRSRIASIFRRKPRLGAKMPTTKRPAHAAVRQATVAMRLALPRTKRPGCCNEPWWQTAAVAGEVLSSSSVAGEVLSSLSSSTIPTGRGGKLIASVEITEVIQNIE
mmetsp:Transcript_137469/g.293787  ORF Transcript_137469/g.293787 Transcript_137469/m.293787 type:complete len:241 (-) Transcript_137469:964-1686(-)